MRNKEYKSFDEAITIAYYTKTSLMQTLYQNSNKHLRL